MKDAASVEEHDGRGPPLLLVHGMLASRSQWLLNLPAFAEFASPVTVELWGHHLSPAPTDPSAYNPSSYVLLFESIRERLGIDRWFIGGCSLGAALTMRYALEHPARVLGQFLTNSSSAFADAATSELWQESSESSYDRIVRGGMHAIDRIAVHPRHAKRLPTEVKQALIDDATLHTVEGVAGTMRWTSPYASVRSRVAANTVPSLLLCGMHERRFQPLRAYAATAMPHLTVVDLPAGHGVNMEAAEAFNLHVKKFVRHVDKKVSRVA